MAKLTHSKNKPATSGGRRENLLLFSLIILLLLSSLYGGPAVYAAPPVVYVDPAYQQVQVGQQFDVNISIDYAENLYGFQVQLSFNNAILNALSIEYMNYLNEPTLEWPSEINNTVGYVSYARNSRSPATGKTGGSPPPLIRINFTALAAGTSQLHFTKTILADDQARSIAHTHVDGTVDVVGIEGHDVAVTAVSLAKGVICSGFCGNITITVQNYGSYDEVFNLTVFANSTIVQKIPISLVAASSLESLVMWNTTSFLKGDYIISANVSIVPEEGNIANNNYVDGIIKITIPGDLDANGKVNILDIVIVALQFGRPPPPITDLRADVNNDGKVNILDIVIVALHFGQAI